MAFKRRSRNSVRAAARTKIQEAPETTSIDRRQSSRTSKYFRKESTAKLDTTDDEDSDSEVVTEDLESEHEDTSGENDGISDFYSSDAEDNTNSKVANSRPTKISKLKRGNPDQQVRKTKRSKPEIAIDNSDAEGGEVFIAKLAALPDGDVLYQPATIHPNSLTFLRDLKLHNERDWFQQRDLQYQKLKSDFDSFVLSFADVIRSIDDTIPELPVKDLTFRIYRDIRFSNDRTPYKSFLAAYFSRSGRKGPWAGYYFSLEPNDKTLLACGLWQPPAADLALVRESIHHDMDIWNSVIEEPGFVEFFGGRAGLLKTEDQLKTCPKGYQKAHEQIELLRLKSFNVKMTFRDEEVIQDAFMEILRVVVSQMVPFVGMLNGIIRPEDVDSE